MKKLISLVVAIVLMLNLTVPAFAATIDDFVEKAAGEVGTTYEMDPNQEYYIREETKYTQWFVGLDWFRFLFQRASFLHKGKWCVMFVSWCSDQVGFGIPAYATVAEMKNWYISEGRFHDWQSYDPKKGDTVFFMSEGKDSHVGIIESVEISPDVPNVPFTGGKCIKLTVIEGDWTHDGPGWKNCSVDRVPREIRTSQWDISDIFGSSNVIVGFGEN